MTFAQPAQPYFYNFAEPGRHRARSTSVGTGDAAAHPDTWAGHQPGRHRAVQGRPVHAEQHPVHGQPDVLAARQALHPEGRVPGLPGQRPGQPRPGQRQGAVGQPVHPEHQDSSTSDKSSEQPHLVAAGDATSRCTRTWTRRTRPPASSRSARRSPHAHRPRRRSRKIGEGGQQPAANQTGVVDADLREVLRRRPRSPRPATTSRTRPRPSSCWPSAGYSPSHPLKLIGHHDHRLHRLGRLARGDQAAARADRHRPDRRRPRPADVRQPAVHRATSTSPTTARPAARRRTTSCAQILYSKNTAPLGTARQQQLRAVQQPRRRRAVRPVRRPPTTPARSRSSSRSRRRCSRTCRSSRRPSPSTGSSTTPSDIGGWPTAGRPVRPAGGVQRPRRRAGAAAPVLRSPRSRRGQRLSRCVTAARTEDGRMRYLAAPARLLRAHAVGRADAELLHPAVHAGQPAAGAAGPHAQQLSPAALQQMLTSFGFKPHQNVVVAVRRLPAATW